MPMLFKGRDTPMRNLNSLLKLAVMLSVVMFLGSAVGDDGF
jgi:hypothetical protein